MQLSNILHRYAWAAALATVLAIGTPLAAQPFVRMEIPGAAFVLEKGHASHMDSPKGRTFTSQDSVIVVKGPLWTPPPSEAYPKLRRLVVHFKSEKFGGADFLAVEVWNGANKAFGIQNVLTGDHSTMELDKPPASANRWLTGLTNVDAHSIIRLSIGFPQGFEGPGAPADFFLAGVGADFEAKPIVSKTAPRGPVPVLVIGASPKQPPAPPPAPRGPVPVLVIGASPKQPPAPPPAPSPAPLPAPLPAKSNAAIYTVTTANELMWYGHTGREDGSFNWSAFTGQRVGIGWVPKQIFSGGDGVIYVVTADGDLLWYRHDGLLDGSFRWAAASGKKIGSGWNYARVFSGGGGVIYAVTAGGDLLWFRHDGSNDGSAVWTAPEGRKVSDGWRYKQVFAGGNGVIYAVWANGDLMWYRHDGRGDGSPRWTAPEGRKVGSGWGGVKHVLSAGDGIIYTVSSANELLWFRHEGRSDGSPRWTANEGRKVGTGWDVKEIFSGATLQP